MAKRVFGVMLLLCGLALTAWAAVSLAFAIPANFSVEGTGPEALVNLIDRYSLRDHILVIGLGLAVTLSSLAMLLAPRRVKARIESTAETVGEAAVTADNTAAAAAVRTAPDSDGGETAPAEPRLVRVICTDLLGTAFVNPKGRSRQQIIREARAGDVAVCRPVAKGRGDDETVGVFTVRGELMGIIDVSLLRAIRQAYPDHRIGVTVDRVCGGYGVPYTCTVRLGVYRV